MYKYQELNGLVLRVLIGNLARKNNEIRVRANEYG